ncbi:acyltransferase domain-containing protein [Actinoplanes sp. NPDC089786]|uniref:acyltransferase domain-containing protein n=1 Tax=Actinoplanes sp. NPDC089786 TaxID=3155185 RepID=UPI0034445C57
MEDSAACAIVGYAFRLPGGIRTADQFWQLLSQRGFIREPIAGRYGPGYEPSAGRPGPDRFGSSYEGLLSGDDFYLFDSRLFGVSVPEANSMDPQSRTLLTCTWEAFEHAGWGHERLRNSRTGVFIGAQDSSSTNWRPLFGPDEYSVSGSSSDMLASRISYTFNLMGPSATYMTACSSGMTALHAAVTALAGGDCDQAVVGASNHLGSALTSAAFAQLGVISPDGACHSFDAAANGYMRSEGAFVYLVKPLAAAQRDGDRILAVVAGTAVNTAGAADGAEGLGAGRMITAPTQHAQVDLMRSACGRAGISPGDVDYLEAHATGTRVGDRIEGNAIREVFGEPPRSVPLRVASVKSNVGHMEAAAFACALLKTLLMFEHRAYAPISSHFAVPNPDIDFTGLRVQTTSEAFGDRPALVGINSFGFGGVNGHAVLAEYRPDREAMYSRPVAPDAGYLFPLSARTPEALRESVAAYRDLLAGSPPFDVYTLAANISRRRTHFPVRTAFAATGPEDLVAQLDAFVRDRPEVSEVEERKRERRILMVFAGQGTQWAGCGRELYATAPIFARTVDAIDAVWQHEAGYSLREACFNEPQGKLDETRLAQPAIFMIEAALVDLLASWGVRADGVVGHSAGEVAAAYAAGILSLTDAARLAFHRSTLQQRTAGSGRMLAVDLDLAGTEALLAELPDAGLEIACENSPVSTVVCGAEASLIPLTEALRQRAITHRMLRGNVAFHSRAMDPIEQPLREGLAFLADRLRSPSVPFVSSVTGCPTERLDAAYWWSNVRERVRFRAAVQAAAAELEPNVVIEVAPHSVLLSAVHQCLEESADVARVTTLRRDTDSRAAFHETLGALFRQGVALDFAAQYPNPRSISHLLPLHPRNDVVTFDPAHDDMHLVKRGLYSAGPLIGRAMPDEHPRFEVRMSAADFSWLTDHRVQNAPIMPAAGYVEMVLEALGGAPASFDHVEFHQPCPVTNVALRLRTELTPEAGEPGQYSFRILSLSYGATGESTLHCTGRVRRTPPTEDPSNVLATLDRSRFTEDGGMGSREAFYGQLNAVLGDYFQYGPHFQPVTRVQRDVATQELLLDLRLDDALWRDGRHAGYHFAVPLLDGALQAFLYFVMKCSDISGFPRRMRGLTIDRLPTSGHLVCHFIPPSEMAAHELGQLSLALGEQGTGSLVVYDAGTGERVARLAEYTSFMANPKADVIERSKFVINWQPKFVTDTRGLLSQLAAEDLTLSAVVTALASGTRGDTARTWRVAEFSQTLEPDRTAAAEYLSRAPGPEQIELWLLGSTAERTKLLFDAFKQGPAVRVATADLEDPDSIDLDTGLLRAAACESVFADARTTRLTDAGWAFLRRLLVPGGVAVIRNPDRELDPPGPGWTLICRDERVAAWSSPGEPFDDGPTEEAGPRWVIGDGGEPLDSLDAQSLYSDATQERLRSLCSIDVFCTGEDDADPSGAELTARFLLLAQALSNARAQLPAVPCRLTVVTRRSVLDVNSPRGAALWGAVRALGHEFDRGISVDLRLVDVGDAADLPVLDWLARHDVRERELAIRSGRLYAPRLAREPGGHATVPADIGRPYRLMLNSPGQLGGLSMRTQSPREPGPHQVLIDVAAAALNFRDVMVTMDLLPPASYEHSALGREVGMEGSGTVVATGGAVSGLTAGQRVMFLKGGCIGDRVVVDADAVFPAPPGLTMEQAAGVLSVYLTAYHGLIDLARLRAGQRVLVHSAMGGVGQAAIALARHAGATVYATAGTPERRARLLDLGVEAAFDSHSYSWYDELMAATDGEGVDVVLNSLAGHHITLCLRALRPGGWHCEIGKVDIYADNALGLAVFRKNLRFAAIDVDRLLNDDPAHARALAQACLRLIEDGTVPPLPVKPFAYGDYENALRFMANGQHEGKLVLTAPTEKEAAGLEVVDRRPFLDAEATYLVTGGMGASGCASSPTWSRSAPRI